METLIIDVAEKQSVLVKQILENLGTTVRAANKSSRSNHKQDLANASVWTNADLKAF